MAGWRTQFNPKMVASRRKLDMPAGEELRELAAPAIDAVAVAEAERCVRVGEIRLGCRLQRARIEEVVRVQPADELARRAAEPLVEGVRLPVVGLARPGASRSS